MSESTPIPKVVNLDAGRRRQAPVSDSEFLHRVLDAHGEIVGAGLDLQKIVEVVTRRAQQLTHSSGAVVELLDGDELVYWAASGTAKSSLGMRVNSEKCLSGLAVKSGRVSVCDDSETDPRVDRDACRRVALRSMLVAPLPYADKIVGVLKVISPFVKAYGPNDIRTLELLNTLIGSAIAHAVQHAAISAGQETRSAIDSLTLRIAHERIQRVLKSEDFDVVVQRIVNIRNRATAGYEALSRFPAVPIRSPDKWFDEAGRVGLSAELELLAIRKSLASLVKIPLGTYLAINVSPATVMRAELEALLAPCDSGRIVLEITEHTSIDDYAPLGASIARLRRLGIRFSVDDVGAGFASLRHILKLQPDFIKLDTTLTHGIDAAPGNQHMVAALLTFAQGTSATIVAEGIETQAELSTLLSIGVGFGQGFLFGSPSPLPI